MKIRIHQSSNENFEKYINEQTELHVSAMGNMLTGANDFQNKLQELIDLGYYDVVTEKETDIEPKINLSDLLQEIFDLGNLDEEFCKELPRYLSVLDIIEIDDKKYIVMPIGFAEVRSK